MKKKYVSPKCELTDYELKTSILTGSTPQNSSGARALDDNEKAHTSTRELGNLW